LGGARGYWDEFTFATAKFDLQHDVERIYNTDIYSSDVDKELDMYSMFWNSGRLAAEN
jgi:hypothetical protein